jgi:hypothetical protein
MLRPATDTGAFIYPLRKDASITAHVYAAPA